MRLWGLSSLAADSSPLPPGIELPLPQPLPALRDIERGTVPDRQTRLERRAGNRLASAPAIISLGQSATSLLTTKAAPLHRDVTKCKGPTSRGRALVPIISLPFPRFSSLPCPLSSFSPSRLVPLATRCAPVTFLFAFSRREIGYPSDAYTATR